MKRLVLLGVIGGGVGAGVALMRSDPSAADSGDNSDLKTAAVSGAAAGGLVGLVLDRRARRKRKRSALVDYSKKARPKVDAALDAAFAAAEIALPKVEAAAQVARERAKERATETAIHARHVAAERAEVAKKKAKRSGHPKAAKAIDLLPV